MERSFSGAGDDYVAAGTGADVARGITTPTSTSFTPPASEGEEVARGFSQVAYRAVGARWQVTSTAVLREMQVAGATASPGWVQGGQNLVESDGNIIDGGAGDDYIAAGTGADVLFGDAGADFIWGDGTQSDNKSVYTPLARHGNDVLSGGVGNDVLVGQGGDDELYGGTGDDVLFGDEGIEVTFGDGNPFGVPKVRQSNEHLDGKARTDALAESVADKRNPVLLYALCHGHLDFRCNEDRPQQRSPSQAVDAEVFSLRRAA